MRSNQLHLPRAHLSKLSQPSDRCLRRRAVEMNAYVLSTRALPSSDLEFAGQETTVVKRVAAETDPAFFGSAEEV